MKVVFLKNVKNVGKINDIKEVSDGYALNFLIPSGSVAKATDDAIAKIQANQQQTAAQLSQKEGEMKALLAKLDKTGSVTITGHAHAKGHLYQAITAQEIALAIKESHDLFIPKDLIMHYDKPIKEAGDHLVTVGDKKHSIQYKVVVA